MKARVSRLAALLLLPAAAAAWAWWPRARTAPAPATDARALAPTAPPRDGRLLPLPEAERVSREAGVPILLLVTPPCRTCPPGELLRAQLCQPDVGASLAQRCVPALLEIDQGAPSEAAAAFLRRHPELVLPAVLVLTAEGDVLHRQVGSLYPPYDLEGAVLPGNWGPLLAPAALADLVEQALARARREDQILADPAQPPPQSLLVEQARILWRRDRLPEAGALAARAAALPSQGEAGRALVHLLRRLGDDARARELAQRLLGSPCEAATRRRLTLALHQLGPAGGGRAVASLLSLEALQAEAGQAGDTAFEALVRAERCSAAIVRGDRRSADEQVTWIVANLAALEGEDCEGAAALARFIRFAKDLGRPGDAALLAEHLIRAYPDRPESQDYKHGGLDALRRERPSVG